MIDRIFMILVTSQFYHALDMATKYNTHRLFKKYFYEKDRLKIKNVTIMIAVLLAPFLWNCYRKYTSAKIWSRGMNEHNKKKKNVKQM